MADETVDQSVFPLTDYLKFEMLSERTKANEYLKKFRRLSEDNKFDASRKHTFFVDFVGEVINLYNDLRDAIFAWNGNKSFSKEEVDSLKEIDADGLDPKYEDKLVWIERFRLLNKFLYAQGLTRLAFDKELSETDGIGRR